MKQSGFKQATIAYRVALQTGEPLDRDGALSSVSGRKQAIALLEGVQNPDASKYEVISYFSAGSALLGVPTFEPSEDCPVASFDISVASIRLSPSAPSLEVLVSSSGAWALSGTVPPSLILTPTSGTGDTVVNVSRTDVLGSGVLYFKQGAIETPFTVSWVNLESETWILETGAWRNFKLWKNNGLWKFNI